MCLWYVCRLVELIPAEEEAKCETRQRTCYLSAWPIALADDARHLRHMWHRHCHVRQAPIFSNTSLHRVSFLSVSSKPQHNRSVVTKCIGEQTQPHMFRSWMTLGIDAHKSTRPWSSDPLARAFQTMAATRHLQSTYLQVASHGSYNGIKECRKM